MISTFVAFSSQTKNSDPIQSKTFGDYIDFGVGVTTGITKGALISGKDLLSSAAQAIVHPVDTCHSTFEAFASLAQLVKSQEWEILGQALAPEICELVNNWENRKSG